MSRLAGAPHPPVAGPARRLAAAALAAALLLAGGGPVAAQQDPAPGADSLRIFFVSDAHSRFRHVDEFVDEANRLQPDLVLEAGDRVHDATEAEIRRSVAGRARLRPPWLSVEGNHDMESRGAYSTPRAEVAAFSAVDFHGVRLILLDNHAERLTEEQFRLLERELESNPGGRSLVVMHVPPLLSRQPASLRLRHLVPFSLASPVMRDPAQVERFTSLMERHGVLAVLAGHTHFPDHVVRGGVHYVVAGPLGGLTPGLKIANEYVDLVIRGREVRVRRRVIRPAPGDPVRFVARAFRFYAGLNQFSHAEQGWSYVPSAGVQLRTGIRWTGRGSGTQAGHFGIASVERNLGATGRHSLLTDLGASAGPTEAAVHLAAGYKLRPIGSFNRGLFVSAAATANAGIMAGTPTSGVGAQLGAGLEWRNLTAEAGRGRATNHRAVWIGLGYRY